MQPFLDIVHRIYSDLPTTVNSVFSEPPPASGALTPSVKSFKVFAVNLLNYSWWVQVLTECPIIVVLLFQLYPRFLATNITNFLPRIVHTLGLQVSSCFCSNFLIFRLHKALSVITIKHMLTSSPHK